MCRILIVEDEEIEKIALKKILLDNISNIEIVAEATTGYEAIDIIDAIPIDLVFMDINIPGINGLNVVKHIKTNYPNVIVIIISAHDEFEIAHSAIKLKVDDYLLKPVKPSVIIETLEQYLKSATEYEYSKECDIFIKELSNKIKNKSYIDSENIIKSYVFYVYENIEDIKLISKMIYQLLNKIDKICKDMNFSCTYKVLDEIEKVKSIPIPYYKKYDLYTSILEVINIIFDEIIDNNKLNGNDINNAINFIERNIKKGITLEDVSNHVNLSIYYLSKIFKREMNINFITYMTERKIEIAKDMLVNTDLPIINIAIELAYNESNYFSKAFKKKVGMTPSEYREKFSVALTNKSGA